MPHTFAIGKGFACPEVEEESGLDADTLFSLAAGGSAAAVVVLAVGKVAANKISRWLLRKWARGAAQGDGKTVKNRN